MALRELIREPLPVESDSDKVATYEPTQIIMLGIGLKELFRNIKDSQEVRAGIDASQDVINQYIIPNLPEEWHIIEFDENTRYQIRDPFENSDSTHEVTIVTLDDIKLFYEDKQKKLGLVNLLG